MEMMREHVLTQLEEFQNSLRAFVEVLGSDDRWSDYSSADEPFDREHPDLVTGEGDE